MIGQAILCVQGRHMPDWRLLSLRYMWLASCDGKTPAFCRISQSSELIFSANGEGGGGSGVTGTGTEISMRTSRVFREILEYYAILEAIVEQ
jgi:hypothetical protein